MATAAAPAVAIPSGAEIAQGIEQAWGEELQASRSSSRAAGQRNYLYASAYHPCARSMFYQITRSDELPAFEPDVLARMERGSEIERSKLLYLGKVGERCRPPFNLIAQQERFELRDRKGRTAIVGKVDARLYFSRTMSCPLEVKAWAPTMVSRIDTFEDLFKSFWTKKGAYQVLSYLFATNEPLGFLLLDRAGVPKLIPVELEKHWDRVEEFLTLAEQVLDHKLAGTEPDYHRDAEVCTRCDWYGSVCNPPLMPKDQLRILADPETEALLQRREELKGSAEEYDSVDHEAKRRLKGIAQGLCGPFLVRGHEVSRKAYSVEATKYWQMTITKL